MISTEMLASFGRTEVQNFSLPGVASLFSSSPDPPIISQAHSPLSPVEGNNRSKRSKANYSKGRWSSHITENESDNNNENGTNLVTPSPDSSLFSSSPDPPILSQAHLSLSPVQGGNIPQSLTKMPKTTPPRHSKNEIEKYCQLLCEKNKTLAQCNIRLQSQLTSTLLHHQQESESFLKRKSQDISLLTTELATHKKKLQQTERTHHSLEQANKKVKKDNQDLVKWLQEAKENVKEQQQEISSLRQEHKERMEAKAKLEFQRGVRQGIQKATKNTIILPDNLTQAQWRPPQANGSSRTAHVSLSFCCGLCKCPTWVACLKRHTRYLQAPIHRLPPTILPTTKSSTKFKGSHSKVRTSPKRDDS
jgi:hypothetical protein